MRRLLIIGAGLEQIEAYKIAKKMGLYVIGTDINPKAPAFRYADEKIIASTRDVIDTVAKVKEYTKSNQISGVMTIANDVPLTVATVATEFNLLGISIKSAQLAADKILMKKAFSKYQVRTPDFWKIKNTKELYSLVDKKNLPLILKPSDGRGGRGVILIDEEVNVEWAWRESIKHSENKILILEKFEFGPQLSAEGIFLDKVFIPIAFADRNYDNLSETKPHIVEDGGVIPSRFQGEILKEISILIQRAALALDISWGTVKADIVITKNGPKIIELAARLSGNYLATHHIPMVYGVNIVKALIKMSIGDKVNKNELQVKQNKYLGVRYFFPPSGKIICIKGINYVERLNYVRMFKLYKKIGDIQMRITDHTKRAGTIICEGPDYNTAKQRVEDAVSKIVFIMG
ncbi:ATP-grasp domain-containing protein [Candidatus Atribacteria bacterium MT.SAG.1]|nr:ATP-grasp domain-containing protein [Candidatus Atribacteria bacterium MT.SAG.1]